TNTDMAKLKSDVLQMHYDKNGMSIRDRLIRDSSKASSIISGGLAKIVNAVQHSGLFRTLMEKLAGFDKRRILPEYASEPFHKWFKKNGSKYAGNPDKTVVLFADTYLNYHEPNVGVGAAELLHSCGYHVVLAHTGCCQRPRISHGFLRDAKEEGTK